MANERRAVAAHGLPFDLVRAENRSRLAPILKRARSLRTPFQQDVYGPDGHKPARVDLQRPQLPLFDQPIDGGAGKSARLRRLSDRESAALMFQ